LATHPAIVCEVNHIVLNSYTILNLGQPPAFTKRRPRLGSKLRRKKVFLSAGGLGAAIGLCLASFVGQGHGAIGQFANSISRLRDDPLSLFAERSPGERTEGELHSTKPDRTSPHERVLSEVRDRSPADFTSGTEGPDASDFGPDSWLGPSNDAFSPQGPFPASPSGFPDIQNLATGPTQPANGEGGGSDFAGPTLSIPSLIDTLGDQGSGTPPQGPSGPGGIIPQGPNTGPSSPGGPDTDTLPPAGLTNTGTPPISVPEPPTWWIMSFGLGIIGVWRARKRSEQAC